MTLPYPPPFQDLRTLAQHVCLGESTIEDLVKAGMFPRPRKIRGKRLWEWEKVRAYLADPEPDEATSPVDLAERIRNETRSASTR